VKDQYALWNNDLANFTTNVIAHLDVFLATTGELLLDADFMNPEHQEARSELERLLVDFDARLVEVQGEFKDVVDPPLAPLAKKLKAKKDKVKKVKAKKAKTMRVKAEDGEMPDGAIDATVPEEQAPEPPGEASVPVEQEVFELEAPADMSPTRSD
jgi:hypothetical protein